VKDHNQNPQTEGQEAFTVPIAGELTSQTSPEDFRRFARLASSSAATTNPAASNDRPVGATNENDPCSEGTTLMLPGVAKGIDCDEITHTDTAKDH